MESHRIHGPTNPRRSLRILSVCGAALIGSLITATAADVTATQPIDTFIGTSLAHAGLTPSADATPGQLLRRLSLQLTGLPPTPEEILAIPAIPPPGWYESTVDRLLNSPRYGERWAQHWLDAAGYADSNGYFNADTDRPLAYRYRDYVVRSLNQDKPFDRFLREQIAGDELSGWKPGEPATPEIVDLLVATHFLRNGQDGSGESDGNPDEVRADRYYALESAMQIMGSALLGLTVQCAKCHDHKFEPFTHRDYYAFQAFLYPAFHIEKWTKPNDRIAKAPLPGELEAWKSTEARLDAGLESARHAFREWSASTRSPGRVLFADSFRDPATLASNWSATAPGDDAPGGTPPVSLASTSAPAAFATNGHLHLVEGGGSGDRWLCTTQSFPWKPATNGAWIQVTFDLVDDRLSPSQSPAERVGYFIAAHDFNDSSSTPGGNILIDGHPSAASVVDVDYPGPDTRHPGRIGSIGYKPGRNYGVRVTRIGPDHFDLQHLVDGATDGSPLRLRADDLPDGAFGFEFCCGRSFIVDNVRIEASDETNPDWAAANTAYESDKAVRRKALEESTQEIASQRTPEPGRIAWMTDSGTEAPPVPLLKRGDHKKPGEPVPPAFPSFLATNGPSPAPKPTATTTGLRTAWVDWLLTPDSPQALQLAKVTVNRVWQQHFGRGIVATPDNLGRSGAKPSHPDLLDWLARDFIQSGWRLKSLQRRILLSHAFRQTSDPATQGIAADPDNRLLWRFPVRRLDAEAIRDAMLASSGRLAPKTSGPYVPTPRDGSGEVQPDPARPEALARTLFLQRRRTQVPTFLGTFDAPSVVFNCTRREGTTMPLQSLALLNSEFSVECGTALAGLLLRDFNQPSARLDQAFLRTLGRLPTSLERNSSMEFLDSQTALHPPDNDPQRRAWNDLCQSLYALNAFLYLE
jgi:hypothetical protein